MDRKDKVYNNKTLANRQIGKAPTSPMGGAFVATRGRLSFMNKSMKAKATSVTAPHHLGRSAVELLGVYVNDDAAFDLTL